MFVFPWLDKYSVQVDKIDEQHKMLVELLNQLASAMSQGKGRMVLESVLEKLVDYTVFHFSEEEKYFDQIDYPQAGDHQKEHADLLEEVIQFKADFDAGNVRITVKLMQFLKEWLINHINGTDKQYSHHLNERGIH